MPIKKDFGNALWLVLHSTALQAKDQIENNQSIESYKQLETNLIPLLPCPQCQDHYQQNIMTQEYANQPDPKHLNQLNYLHNQVNKLFNKPIFSLEESSEFINNLNNENPKLLIIQFYKSVMTLANYWNSFFWIRPKKRFKHNIPNFKSFVTNSMKLLSLAEPEEINEYWKNTPEPYQSNNLYQFFLKHHLPQKHVPENFSFDLNGCGCLNK